MESFDFVEKPTPALSSRVEILTLSLDNPEINSRKMTELRRELGHIGFELWCREQTNGGK